MVSRPKHQKPEGEKVLKDAEAHGCTVTKRNSYYKIKCRCGQHLKTFKLTPSNPNTFKHDHSHIQKWPCWSDEDTP